MTETFFLSPWGEDTGEGSFGSLEIEKLEFIWSLPAGGQGIWLLEFNDACSKKRDLWLGDV